MAVCETSVMLPVTRSYHVMDRWMSDYAHDLARWVTQGLITAEQSTEILAFERDRSRQVADDGPGRLANGISTVGAVVAVAATAGVMALFAGNWTSGQAMLAAIIASIVLIVAGWQLVRNGWGAPAGLCALGGLVLIPVALGLGTDAVGWWPEENSGGNWEQVEREQQRIIGIVLLVSILPGMLTTRLGLRQAWMALPGALWFGATLLFTNPVENIELTIVQVILNAGIAGAAIFVWRPGERGRGSAWWLQLGGLILAAQGIMGSAFERGPIFALIGVVAAALLFIVGATRNRTAWMVAGALSGVFPIGSLVFEYFEGMAGLIIVAVIGLVVAFLPLILLHRRTSPGVS